MIRLQKIILFISSILITLGLFLAVIFRYILKMDLFGIEELLIIPTFSLYFFAAAQASYERSHIAADLIDSYVSNEKVKNFIHVINSIFILVVCLIFTYWNVNNVLWVFSNGAKTAGWEIPLFIPHSIVLIGFVLMTIYTIIHLYKDIASLRYQLKGGS